MMRAIHTHNLYHLGDNLIHLGLFLRRCALNEPNTPFFHFCHAQYIDQLREVISDVPNLRVRPLNERPPESVDCWKNRKGDFYEHLLRDNWIAFHLQFFQLLADDLGCENPIRNTTDLLFDYPALKKRHGVGFDYLVVNSMPHSNQIAPQNFDPLIEGLLAKGHSVVTTAPHPRTLCTIPLTVSAIGALSFTCKNIVGIATGPMWPCFNVWNGLKRFLVLLESERILFPNVQHARNVGEAMEMLGIA